MYMYRRNELMKLRNPKALQEGEKDIKVPVSFPIYELICEEEEVQSYFMLDVDCIFDHDAMDAKISENGFYQVLKVIEKALTSEFELTGTAKPTFNYSKEDSCVTAWLSPFVRVREKDMLEQGAKSKLEKAVIAKAREVVRECL